MCRLSTVERPPSWFERGACWWAGGSAGHVVKRGASQTKRGPSCAGMAGNGGRWQGMCRAAECGMLTSEVDNHHLMGLLCHLSAPTRPLPRQIGTMPSSVICPAPLSALASFATLSPKRQGNCGLHKHHNVMSKETHAGTAADAVSMSCRLR